MISPHRATLPGKRVITAAEIAKEFNVPEHVLRDMELAFEPSGAVEIGFWPFKTESIKNGITTRWAKGKVFKFRRRQGNCR